MRNILFVFLLVLTARADNAWEGQSLSFSLDNDTLTGNDRHYTAGTSILYLSRDDAMFDWTRWISRLLPPLGFELQAEKWGVEVGQQIYTPEDLQAAAVIRDDRPYAGWLYARAALQRRGASFGSSLGMDWFGLDIGVVGPESLAEYTQDIFHGDPPDGWHNQLETELTVNLRYVRRQLFEQRWADWRLHLIPFFDASAGNVDTHLGGGARLRFGYNVPNEFEVPRTTTQPGWGAYVYSGVGGRWVIRNLFLDGSSFRSSHSVDKEPLIGNVSFGVGMVFKRLEILVAHTFLSHEFEEQDTDDSFTSATVVFKF